MSLLRTRLQARRRVLIMGIVNRTPDSFSDGGLFFSEEAARARIDALVAEGADIIDIGAESTRPGAKSISDDEQIARIGNTIEHVVKLGALASIDTTSPRVARHAIDQGAQLVNSVLLDPAQELGALCAKSGVALALMHCRSSMSLMPGFSIYPDDAYTDVVADVVREWTVSAERAMNAGLPREDLLLDPGLGFTKNARHSMELCARLDELCALDYPVLVGPSRKSFLVRTLAEGHQASPTERLGGSIAATLACAFRGASIVRVHDVAVVKQALDVAYAIEAAARTMAIQNHPRMAGAYADV